MARNEKPEETTMERNVKIQRLTEAVRAARRIAHQKHFDKRNALSTSASLARAEYSLALYKIYGYN